MKYKNISKNGHHIIKEKKQMIKRKGQIVSMKIKGVWKAVLPGETIECATRLNEPNLELVEEKKPTVKKATVKVSKSIISKVKKVFNKK